MMIILAELLTTRTRLVLVVQIQVESLLWRGQRAVIYHRVSQMMFTTYNSSRDLLVVCYVGRMLSLDYSGDLYMRLVL
ncbi:hypothetical protein Q1695_016452 [Nippostrongylus brasiliensis]|nr:hypothetical protein Q1695_016452 [Nippostrongylus brasiliensis]